MAAQRHAATFWLLLHKSYTELRNELPGGLFATQAAILRLTLHLSDATLRLLQVYYRPAGRIWIATIRINLTE